MALVNMDKKTCLHLGCGCKLKPHTPLETWYNLDQYAPTQISPNSAFIIRGDILNLTGLFPANTFDKITSTYVFEHLEVVDILDLLYQMWLVLKPEGVVEVKVPNFLKIIAQFDDRCSQDHTLSFEVVNLIYTRIFCSERETKHKSVWTPYAGVQYLSMEGFFDVKLINEEEDQDFTMTFRMEKKEGGSL